MATASTSTSKSTSNGTTPGDIEKQLETIRDDISELTQQVLTSSAPQRMTQWLK